MRVAVTGGSGRVGRFTVQELLRHGYAVRNVDRQAPPAPGGEFVPVDLLRPEAVLGALQGCDAVIHLAALPNPNAGLPLDVFRVNLLSTMYVLDAAAQLGLKRLVLASSVNAIGMGFNREVQYDYLPLDEAHPCRPDEPYGLSKQLGELAADSCARRHAGLTIASLRYCMVLPQAQLPEWLAVDRRRPPRQGRDLWAVVAAEETARANRLALEADFRAHQVFFITAAENCTRTPSRALAAEFFPTVPLRDGLDGRAPLISPAKAERVLGWRHAPLFPD